MSLLTPLGLQQPPLFLMDGSAFIYRGFYAYPDLKRSDGFPTNSLFIVLRTLLKILREEKPRHFAFIRDGKGPTFRNEIWQDYKANRQKTPEGLIAQLAPLDEALGALGIKTLVSDGVEADDLIATLTSRFKTELPVVIVGADKDLHQCLDDNVLLWDPAQKKEKLISLTQFQETEQLTPQQWPDFQALTGDSTDNIPGVPGIGPKTALKILSTHPTLEKIRDNFSTLEPKLQKKIAPHLEAIFTYRELTRLKTDCQTPQNLAELEWSGPDTDKLREFLREYEFRSLLQELEAATGSTTSVTPAPKIRQTSLQQVLPGLEPVTAQPDRLTTRPALAGQDVLCLRQETGWHIITEAGTWPCPDSLDSLLPHLTTSRVFLVDLKQHIARQPEWAKLKMVDVGLVAYLLNPEERDYSWGGITEQFQETFGTLKALELARAIAEQLQKTGLENLFTSLEQPLVAVLARMERRGIRIDLHAFSSFLNEVQTRLATLQTSIFKHAGMEFNIRSSQQLAEILFDRLELASKRKTAGGQLSTASEVLEKLRGKHPIIADILEFRSLEKMRSTYLEPLPRLVDEHQRLHSHFNQMATATGRLSSSSPNLQNIPIRGEMGERMRACFIARQGCLLVGADYSQIELRVLAHFSGEENLLSAFRQEQDIHARTAAILNQKEVSEISSAERRNAKTINFGLLYGMGPQKLARELAISLQEAREFIAIYFEQLPGIRQFYEQVETTVRKQGYVTTLAGRRRLLSGIHSRNQNLAQQARRMAINTVVQGSAADIIKMAMLAVENDQDLKKMRAELILQVHDELLLEVPQEHAETAQKRLRQLMENVYTLRAPLRTDSAIGQNWAMAH